MGKSIEVYSQIGIIDSIQANKLQRNIKIWVILEIVSREVPKITYIRMHALFLLTKLKSNFKDSYICDEIVQK